MLPSSVRPFGGTAFTTEQQQQIEEFLSAAKPVCPVCHTQEWLYADRVDIHMAGQSNLLLPLLPLICARCGNTQLINLKVLGVAGFAVIPPPPGRFES